MLEPVHRLAEPARGRRARRPLGFDTLWTWDHLYPIVGDHEGPIFEGWLTLAAWAQATERVRIGLMVGANTFREPALTAKMATTLDHISNGRAILGIGGGVVRDRARGLRPRSSGTARPERLRWLGEALPIMRGMLHGERPTATGPRYAAKAVRNDPPPIQERLPLLIGGGGEQVTLKLVARYGDANNVGGGLEQRPAQGGDPPPALRDGRPRPGRDRADDRHRDRHHPRLAGRGRAGPDARSFERNGGAERWKDQPVGTPEDVAERLAPFLEHRLPPPHRRLPVAVRRGVDDPPRDGGPADPRARLS